jgi:hypothetical protein
VVGVAEGVGDVVVAVGLPPAVDGHAGHDPDDPEVVRGGPSTLRMAVEQGEKAGRGGMHPVEPPSCPVLGLVEVHDGWTLEKEPGGTSERLRGIGCLGDHLGQGPDRDRCAEHVPDHLTGISDLGQMFAGSTALLALFAGRCPTLGTGRCRGLGEPFGRWWHRRVPRVPAEALFNSGQLRLEHGHLGPQ